MSATDSYRASLLMKFKRWAMDTPGVNADTYNALYQIVDDSSHDGPNGEAPQSEIVERERALAAIEAEPEVPGHMPDEMWEAIRNDRDACENTIRIAVRQTKEGIRGRYLAQR